MPRLFGLDIAALVDTSIQAAGGVLTGTLVQSTPGTRTPGDPTGGTNPTTTSYSIRGFFEFTERRRDDSLVTSRGTRLSVLGNSLPEGIEPGSGDVITLNGETGNYTVVRVINRDPAAALYVLEVEG